MQCETDGCLHALTWVGVVVGQCCQCGKSVVKTLLYKTALKYHMQCITNAWLEGAAIEERPTGTTSVAYFHNAAIVTEPYPD